MNIYVMLYMCVFTYVAYKYIYTYIQINTFMFNKNREKKADTKEQNRNVIEIILPFWTKL